MFKFSHWFVCVASFLVFFVVCEGQSIKKLKEDGVAAFKSTAAVTLTEEEKQAVVNRHNFYRRKEGASDMKKMKWSQFLADMAAEWVSSCVVKHGHPSRLPKDLLPFIYIGQNLYKSTGAQRDLVRSIDRYFEEKKDFNYGTNSCKAGKICGHYTQVVWSLTTDIGCGVAHCNSSKGPWWYYLCNYGPGGNCYGQKPYDKGRACSQCNGTKLCDDGLCKT